MNTRTETYLAKQKKHEQEVKQIKNTSLRISILRLITVIGFGLSLYYYFKLNNEVFLVLAGICTIAFFILIRIHGRLSFKRKIKDALVEMSLKGLGMTAITRDNQLIGLFTDGDLRRILDEEVNIHQDPITSVMTLNPTVASADMLAAEALKIMEDKKINGLIIVDDKNTPIGAMNMHDLLKSGVL